MFLKTNIWLVNEKAEERRALMRRINDSEEAIGEQIVEGEIARKYNII